MVLNALKLLRIHQWLKNLMLFFPPFLGGALFTDLLTLRALLPFLSFCFASSATYIANDLFDRDNDRHHPEKHKRAIASGRVPVSAALATIVLLLCCASLAAAQLSGTFRLLLVIYVAISLSYSMKLKDLALVDIFCISAGFLLRLQAGGVAFGIPVSEWLFLSVFLLAVFLSTGKRLAEKQRLGEEARRHRKALAAYPAGFLDGIMYMTGGSVLVTYTMYAITRHSFLLLYSVPVCCFGLLRYILRIQSGKGGDPTESLLKDLPLLITGAAWACMVGFGIYGR